MQKRDKIIEDDEIDLLELAGYIWSKRNKIVKITILFVVLGVVVALVSKVEYKSSSKLLPENQEGKVPNLGGLGSLAGIAGVNLSGLGGGDGFAPELYPEIVYSTPFLTKLVNTPVYFENLDKTVSYMEYVKEFYKPSLMELIGSYTIGLPGKIRKALRSENDSVLEDYNLVRLTKEDWELIEGFKDKIIVAVDPATNIISVSIEFSDAVATAMLVQELVNELTIRLKNYNVEKAISNMEFIEQQLARATEDYNIKQQRLAQFSDKNRNITNALNQIEFERLQNELDLAFEVYKGLATQLEQAKIEVNEESMIFTVLEPVRVPEDKIRPKRGLIVVSLGFFGVLFSIGMFLLKKKYSNEQ